MNWSNPKLMVKVREELLDNVKNNNNYCDEMFGSLFHDIIMTTPEIVPRFSCQGHINKVMLDENGEWVTIKSEGQNPEIFYSITHPYIYFLCTLKGKDIIFNIYNEIIKRASKSGIPIDIFKLTIDHYTLDEPEEKTARITLTVDGGVIPKYEEIHVRVIDIIKESIYEILKLQRKIGLTGSPIKVDLSRGINE